MGADRRPTPTKGFRPDIQGLRAVAVGVVLLHHAGAPFVPGGYVGVDIFFVISGFLITGLLLRESAATGRISLTGFYAKRAKRILPAASVVLVLVAAVTVLVLPRTRWDDIAVHLLGSASYMVNWIFAANTDYLNADEAASPLQHFWTLAVEEQFYIVWPVLLVMCGLVARERVRGPHLGRARINEARREWLVRGAVAAVILPSLAYSVYLTEVDPAPAYFVTTTRLWELGIGATVAVFAVQLARIPRLIAGAAGWAGLGAILASVVFYSTATPFPGYHALLPTLGAAAIIIGGMAGRHSEGVGSLLTVKPMTWTGDISYSLYLWHWPMIVVGTYLLDGLEVYQGLLIAAAAFLPSYLSYRYVERAFMTKERVQTDNWHTLRLGAAFTMVALLAGLGVLLVSKPVQVSAQPIVGGNVPAIEGGPSEQGERLRGAAALARDPALGIATDAPGAFLPSPLDAADDIPAVYDDGCHQEASGTDLVSCVYGDPDSDFTVALVGDSHAAQWAPALTVLAEKNGWRLESYTKSSCPLISTAIAVTGGDTLYAECGEWNAKAMDALTGDNQPDFVLLGMTDHDAYRGSDTTEPQGSIVEGFVDSWSQLQRSGVSYAVLQDTPKPRIDVPECLSANAGRFTECAVRSDEANVNGSQYQLRAAAETGDELVNLNASICPEPVCAAIVGGVLVYRDSHHLTATYSESLATALEAQLRRFDSIPFP